MKAVIFDLDDTLYPEIEFVRSGFKIVSRYISLKNAIDDNLTFKKIMLILEEHGRGKVFDILLNDLGIYSEDYVNLLLYLYRSHCPTINLYPEADTFLKELKHHNIQLGIISDGMASVQKNKISALGIDSYFDIIILTDELGKHYWKPSLTPFKIALSLLEVQPNEAIYIGDNVSKDFIAPNKLGMESIQLNSGRSSINEVSDNSMNPKFIANNFEEISRIILGK